ncbi:N-acetyl-alpha-D-glucosaminyl L-malate synthase BshA [Rivularia sp. PCC 7116]|uniref:N-acetyl-alpha-D-glucosaminyl L-malate synthase BshA n=1 Tax=Rivularia sp. PCC 7116 TaxID=373994 RepID=UPI00029EEE4C|nr:N-acetyl-alpha-D-glucosaminyl L-malate synthase BshA [Rivularia sp. PCC 7116]AFY57235.1 N-acetyl-alpha-D-glucosaminyl L-malate synthase BshA [Rivularia sp. PCC 7116]
MLSSPTITNYSSITSNLPSERIAILCLGGLGGSGKVATELAQQLTSTGNSIFLFTSPEAQWVNQNNSVNYIPVNAPKTPTPANSQWIEPLANEIIHHIETHNIGILNIHYAVGLIEAALLAKQELATKNRKLKVCLTLHGSDITKFAREPQYKYKLKKSIEKCDRITAVSHWLADEAVRLLELKTPPTVIHNAIDLNLFQPFPRWNTNQNYTYNLCHVSNLRDVKRPLDAIAVLARVRGAGIPARLLMIGDGPNLTTAKQHALSLGVSEHVIFLGSATPSELVRWLSISDLQLVTSQSESFCLAALEAMACSVPVVGTFCGGLEEVIGLLDKDLPELLLSVPGDTAAMAAKVVQLFKNPQLYQKLRNTLPEKIKHRFSRQNQLQNYSNLFAAVIN